MQGKGIPFQKDSENMKYTVGKVKSISSVTV